MSMKVRVVRGWVWPGLLFLLLGVFLATFSADAPWLVATTGLYPPVVYGAGLFLAWRYRRSRVAAVLIGLFMMDMLLRPSSALIEPGVGSVWDASGVLFLFLMPVVAAMKDRGVLSSRGFIQVLVILVGLAGGLMVWAVRPEFLAWTWQPFLPWDLSGLRLSDALLIVGVFALVLTGALAFVRGHRLDKGFFWVVVALLLALGGGPESVESTIYLTMAGLMLAVNVLEKSYALSLLDKVTLLPARRAMRREIKKAGSSYALALVGVDHYKVLHDRYGRDASDRVIKEIAKELKMVGRHARVFRYSAENFALLFAGKGRNEVLSDLEGLRAEIEDFRYPVRRKTAKNGKSGGPEFPTARWSRTVTVGVAEREAKKGWWFARYGAVTRAARRALQRGQKAGGNTVSK
jgi:diguanylate cyclase (GGDEF)-like protein